MKTVVRRVDKLGRIVLPRDFRKALLIALEDEILLNLSNGEITIKKNGHYCKICGQEITADARIHLCKKCAEDAITFYS